MALKIKKSTPVAEEATQETKLDAEVSSFKGKPMIDLPLYGRGGGNGRPVRFGVSKAKTILMYLEELQEFVRAADAGDFDDIE